MTSCVRETLLGEYRENLEIIEAAELAMVEAGADLVKAREKWELAQQLWGARVEKQDAVIAVTRAEIVQCRIGLQMKRPFTGHDLPPELEDVGEKAADKPQAAGEAAAPEAA